ncbi:MAG TPA: hypothetical protein GX005_05435 [Bacteroidales bacterium]|nr:hypothetical protein [Bacteroidales bacterium]
MKKLFATICLVLTLGLFSTQTFAQQGKFKGIVKYALIWEGEVPPGAPTSLDIKVFENQTAFDDMFSGSKVLTNAKLGTSYALFDFSQVPVEGVTGKWYIKDKMDPKELENNTYDVTSETKEIAGKTTKKVNVTMKSEDGAVKNETIWMCEEMGPEQDLRFYPGLKGMPFEFPVDLDKFQVTFKVSEIIEGGKVEKADMLLPTGYEEVTVEEFQEIIAILMEAIGGGQGDDI